MKYPYCCHRQKILKKMTWIYRAVSIDTTDMMTETIGANKYGSLIGIFIEGIKSRHMSRPGIRNINTLVIKLLCKSATPLIEALPLAEMPMTSAEDSQLAHGKNIDIKTAAHK